MSDQTNMETIANNCSWVQSWIILCVLSPSWDIGGLSVGGGEYCLVKGPLGCPSANSWWPFKFFRPSRQTSRVRHCVDRMKMEKNGFGQWLEKHCSACTKALRSRSGLLFAPDWVLLIVIYTVLLWLIFSVCPLKKYSLGAHGCNELKSISSNGKIDTNQYSLSHASSPGSRAAAHPTPRRVKCSLHNREVRRGFSKPLDAMLNMAGSRCQSCLSLTLRKGSMFQFPLQ